ncbi:unnamed protein product, partial [Gongylonema pulchrum]|uniref:Uncharacterized protein n=1 Tax=Gongylonema pulchrum TaxID=637853 RepID=A0A183EM19_9BILA
MWSSVSSSRPHLRQWVKEFGSVVRLPFKRRQRCTLCSRSNGVLRNDGDRCILIDFSGASNIKRAKILKKGQPVRATPLDNIENIEAQEVDSDEDGKKEEDEKIMIGKGTAYGSFTNSAQQTLKEQMALVTNGNCDKLAWRGAELREHFRMVWKNDGNLLKKMFPDENYCPMDILFCETVQVPPTKYRPIRIFKGDKFENPQSVNLRKVLEASETIRAIRLALTGNNDKSLL